MKERIIEFLRKENKSSAQLAEEINVQASGISHILSGRNNPSLDFVLKMLEKYQFLSTEWLLFGKGSMYKEPGMQTLFDYDPVNIAENEELRLKNEGIRPEIGLQDSIISKNKTDPRFPESNNEPDVIKIVWFYGNKTFKEFVPHG